MNKTNKGILLLSILIPVIIPLTMQAEEFDITVLSYNYGDSVALRWAPSSEQLFQKSMKSGYVVQRRKKGESLWKTISDIQKPQDEREWRDLVERNSEASVMKEMFYPEEDHSQAEPPSDPREGVIESIPGETPIEEALFYMMALFSCDVSVEVANASALYYVDRNVEKKGTYEYRVIFSDEMKDAANVSTTVVDISKKTILPQSDDFSGEFEENFAQFSWNTKKHTGYYSAYNVERSVDGIHYTMLRKRPFVHSYTNDELMYAASFRDTFPNDDATYYYRLKGYSPFGLYGPASNVVKGSPKFNFERIDLHTDTVVVSKRSETIKWSVDKGYEKKIKGYKISRTEDYKKFHYENEGLIPPTKRNFKISPKYEKSQYYAVIAVGVNSTEEKPVEKQSNYWFSFRTDSIPPAIPKGLKAEIDSTGLVKLSWNENNDADIQGYRLYVSNSGRDDDYYSLNDTICHGNQYAYTIPLNTLSNTIFYRILSIDLSYNQSQWSDPVKLIKPDTIPPVPVLFKFLKQPEERVIVEWENSPSEDVATMDLYRQIDDTGKVVMMKHYDLKKKKETTVFEDTYSFSGERVQYFMYLYDEVGNLSKSRTDILNTKGERPGCIGNLKTIITADEQKKEIRLEWDLISNDVLHRFIIYRKKDDETMVDVASKKGNELYYVDENLKIGATYRYCIRPISMDRVCPAIYSETILFQGKIKD